MKTFSMSAANQSEDLWIYNSRCKESFVVVLFRAPSNQRDIATGIGPDCFDEGVYSLKKGIASTVNANVSQRSLKMRKRTYRITSFAEETPSRINSHSSISASCLAAAFLSSAFLRWEWCRVESKVFATSCRRFIFCEALKPLASAC